MDILYKNSFRTDTSKRDTLHVIFYLLTSHIALVIYAILYTVIGAGIFATEHVMLKGESLTFGSAWHFCMAVVTTIGYGDHCPFESHGRALTVVYAILGIPLFYIAVLDIAVLLGRCLKAVCSKIIPSKISPYVAITIGCFTLLVYILLGGLIPWDHDDYQWNYGESLYFIFISLTTIGFGDFVMMNWKYLVLHWIYIVIRIILEVMVGSLIVSQIFNLDGNKGTEEVKIQLVPEEPVNG